MKARVHLPLLAASGLLGALFVGCDRPAGNASSPSTKSTPSRKALPTAPPPGSTAANGPPATPPPPSRNISDLTADNAPDLRDELRKDPGRWNSALGPFYRTWGTLDPEAALRAAGTEGRTSVAAVTMALSGWTSTDPDAAAAWLSARPDGPHRDRHAAGLVRGWPADRMTELAAHVRTLSTPSSSSTLPVRLTARWLHEDPAAAAAWLENMPASNATSSATDLLFHQWGAADPTAAGEFLTNNPEAPNWDVAAAAYAKAVVPDDPETAALWADAIANPDLRGQIMSVIPLLHQPRDPENPGQPTLPGGP